ncbi:CHASE2 domain-containing protein [Aerosakkonema funiforme]|uniref:CHASE2 domain-containing protein n=1 Tax=Aerosakkonema funiforme TaxID=1246630 RepID=UPI0035BC7CE4
MVINKVRYGKDTSNWATGMIKQLSKSSIELWTGLKQRLWLERRVLITSSTVAVCIILLRCTGLLQSWEWAALDWFFRLRPSPPVDDRILIVAIEEENLQKYGWPIPDRVMAQLLQKLHSKKPRAIGLDIYRDLPEEPGHTELQKAFANIPNIVGIEKVKDKTSDGVLAPPALNRRKQVGFNNVVVDADGKVRRSLLYCWVDNKLHTSFALYLALIYLKAEGIEPQAAKGTNYLQLGKTVFRPFESKDGGYVRTDDKGYQILGNFRKPSLGFRNVSMTDVLENKIPQDWVRDRIVLIGSTASSLKDFFYTPYTSDLVKSAQPIPGVELQANFLGQILTAAQSGQGTIAVWSDPIEWLWILVWSWLGAILIWRSRSVARSILILLLAGNSLIACAYLAFLAYWWIPVIPPLVALAGSATVITAYIAQLKEELKRSKEFLQNVINAIPDPVFVKDKQHRWIVLNQAYCQFLGYPFNTLIEKTDYNFFPSHEADIFWQQDELVFQSAKPTENEERFTDARGNTHLIATKRSLHTDAAGNVFLVGVIRDITERKRLEEDLKRTAAELVRYNTELKLSQDRLRHLAYHDSLTGLPNRKLFYEQLSQSLEWAAQNERLLALLFLDLDGFKQINDTQGHDMGDLLLQGVADRLTNCLRSSDTVSRLGGDEFTVILPIIKSVSDVTIVADKIIDAITQPFVLNGQTINVTISIGISLFPLNGDDMNTLIKNADAAMYRAKQQGKNKYEFL